MATIIYNHREIEYMCQKLWNQIGDKRKDFIQDFLKKEETGSHLTEKMKKLENYVFDQDYAMDYGMDTLRLYALFEKFPVVEDDYKESSLEGIYKFLNRFMTLAENSVNGFMGIEHNETKALQKLNDHVQKESIQTEIEEKQSLFYREMSIGLERDNSHSIIAAFMEYCTNLSQISKKKEIRIPMEYLNEIFILLAPYAPFMSEHLWQLMKNKGSVFEQVYPSVTKKQENATISLAVQINGKTKKIIQLNKGLTQAEAREKIEKEMGQQIPDHIQKEIFVPDKVYNFLSDI